MLKKNGTVILIIAGLFSLISCGNKRKESVSLEHHFYLEKDDFQVIKNIAVAGDPHWGSETCNPDERLKILKNIGKRSYDAFICLGDVAENSGKKEIYNHPVKSMNQCLKDIPVLAVSGEQDGEKNKELFNKVFFDDSMFDKKNKFTAFRMDFSETHFIFMDDRISEKKNIKKALKWISSELESIPLSDKVIVFSHLDFLSSGSDNSNTISRFIPVFEKYEVDLVVSGHRHMMELLEKNGVHYIISGAMGEKLDSVNTVSPFSLWNNNSSYGFVELNLSEKEKISFAFFDSRGKHLKSYEISSQ